MYTVEEKQFTGMILLAICLHLSALVLWEVIGGLSSPQIPNRNLHIRLGNIEKLLATHEMHKAPEPDSNIKADSLEMMKTPVPALRPAAKTPPVPTNVVPIKRSIDKVKATLDINSDQLSGTAAPVPRITDIKEVSVATESKQQAKSEQSNKPQEKVVKISEFIENTKQQTQEASSALKEEKVTPKRVKYSPDESAVETVRGTALGNTSDADAKIIARYEQVIAAWIEKRKEYPAYAKNSGMEGNPVIRIAINRDGKVLSSRIEQSSGHSMLDDAALDMVRRANPVPGAPYNYPAGNRIEFLVPVRFTIER